MKQKRKNIITVLLIFVAMILILPVSSFSQTIETAREKYNNKDYDGAEEELKTILDLESDNIEAQSLLREIEITRKQEKSKTLTERALIEINDRNFDLAFEYLEEAILIDPENTRARELYLSIHEIAEIEKESIEVIIDKEELLALKEEEKVIEEPEAVLVEKKPLLPSEEVEKIEKKPEWAITSGRNRAFIRLSTSFTIANSNNLDYIDSTVSMLGGKLDGRYYFNFLQRRLGVSLDYTVLLIKTSGDENIKFLTHRINTSARFRTFFFEENEYRLTVGARINYHIFLLQNRENLGVYNFTRIYGPSFGVFVSDPVIYRFVKRDFFKNAGFEGEINYLFIIGRKNAPYSPEFYLGTYYDLDRYRFSLGYRRYTIRDSDIKESYNDIEMSAGYSF